MWRRPSYDAIGRNYAQHRRPDPRIAAQIHRALGPARTVVDVGSGTGSYQPAGRVVVAVEPSTVMIGQRSEGSARVIRAVAECLPLRSGAFDAAMALLTVHHWLDAEAGLRELRRVAETVVVFTFDPAVHRDYWLLHEYLPEVGGLASMSVPSPEAIAEIIGADLIDVVPVPADCTDGFNWAYWRRPHAYLDPRVRACISGIASLPDELVEQRMARLRRDLADGSWLERHGDLTTMDAVDGGFRIVARTSTRPIAHQASAVAGA